MLYVLFFLLGAVGAWFIALNNPRALGKTAQAKAALQVWLAGVDKLIGDQPVPIAKFRELAGNPVEIAKALATKGAPSVGPGNYPNWFWMWLTSAYCLAMAKRCKAAAKYWREVKNDKEAEKMWLTESHYWSDLAQTLPA